MKSRFSKITKGKRGSKIFLGIGLSLAILIAQVTPAFGFSDNRIGSWYYEYVKFMEDQRISAGYGDGSFKPNNKVSTGESMVLVMKTLGIAPDEATGGHWASGYFSAAEKVNATGNSTLSTLDSPIKRSQVAVLMYKLMGLSTEVGIPPVFADISTVEINQLYEMGIFGGYTENGKLLFKPNNFLTRAELSVVIKKLYDYKEGPEEDTEEEIKLSAILSKEETQEPTYPVSVKDFEKVLLNMAVKNQFKRTVPYTTGYTNAIKSRQILEVVNDAFANVFATYPEYFGFTNQLLLNGTYGSDNYITIDIGGQDYTDDEVTERRTIFLNETKDIVISLYKSGIIDDDMSETQKAREMYEWVVLNTKYDESLDRDSFNGYGASHLGMAVCQGYTALYNTMLKLVGIKAQGIAGSASGSSVGSQDHIWTLAELDGKTVHIDVTFGDPVPDRLGKCDFTYFAVDSDFMRKDHVWDRDKFGM